MRTQVARPAFLADSSAVIAWIARRTDKQGQTEPIYNCDIAHGNFFQPAASAARSARLAQLKPVVFAAGPGAVAHRLAMVKNADRIVVMNLGRVADTARALDAHLTRV